MPKCIAYFFAFAFVVAYIYAFVKSIHLLYLRFKDRNFYKTDTIQYLPVLLGNMIVECNCGNKADAEVYVFVEKYIKTRNNVVDPSKLKLIQDKCAQTVNAPNRELLLEVAIRKLKNSLSKQEDRLAVLDLLCKMNEKGEDATKGWDFVMYIAKRFEVHMFNNKQ